LVGTYVPRMVPAGRTRPYDGAMNKFPRQARRESRSRLREPSLAVVVLGIALFFLGLGAHVFRVNPAAIVVAVLGAALFVVSACWRAAHPDHPPGWPPQDNAAGFGSIPG
jgi:hypothetical protein